MEINVINVHPLLQKQYMCPTPIFCPFFFHVLVLSMYPASAESPQFRGFLFLELCLSTILREQDRRYCRLFWQVKQATLVVTVKTTQGISSQNKMSHTQVIQGNQKNTPPYSSTEPGIQAVSRIAVFLRISNRV